jgi:hypothetical protein
MSKKAIIWFCLGVLAIGLATRFVFIPIYVRNHTRVDPAVNSCANTLAQIAGAKEQWALEFRKTTNDAPTIEDLRPYLGRGNNGNLPKCPAGGLYVPGSIGQPPRCTVHGSMEKFFGPGAGRD